jgi:dTDP-glucose 4,6-dehydratase
MSAGNSAHSPRRLLITGGCGFIGSNFVRHILESDPVVFVVNLDALTYCGNPENLLDVEGRFRGRYRFIHGDIRDRSAVREAMKDCDVVVHFAAESHVDRSITGGHDFITTNVEGTYILLEEARAARISRFLHISTDEVYGSTVDKSFCEEDVLDPSSLYYASKASADLLVRSFHITHGLPIVITRSTNNFGPFQYPEKLIPLFVTNLLEGKKVPLYGDGLNVRDWLHVSDNCRALETVLRKGVIGGIYNVGAGNEVTNREITDTILDALGLGKEMIDYVADRPGHDRRYSVTIDKVRALGWQPARDFRQAIVETVDWYRNHDSWWRKLKPLV